MAGDLKDEAASKVAGGQQHLNGSSVIHFLRFLMSLLLQEALDQSHLVVVVHHGWWTA